MTLSILEGHSPIASLFKCNFEIILEAGKAVRMVVPLLLQSTLVSYIKCYQQDNISPPLVTLAITVFLS